MSRPQPREYRSKRRRVPAGLAAGDRGSTTVQAAGYTVLMLLAIMVLVQAAVWALADLSARHAAQEGVQTARVTGGTAQTGEADAAQLLAGINPNGLTNVTIVVERNADTATVTVTGTVLQVIPVVSIPVNVQAQAPTEPDQ